MQSLLPITSRIRRRICGATRITDVASEIVEIAPPSIRLVDSAISLANEIDRVESFEPTNSPQVHYDRLYQMEQRHGATIAYALDDALIYRGSVYLDRFYRDYTRSPKKSLITGEEGFLQEAQFAASPLEHVYFGHWLHDTLPTELLASERGLQAVRPKDPWFHSAGYRKMLGTSPLFEEHARFGRLWVVDDRGLNDNWASRYEKVRNVLRNVGPQDTSDERIFISRGVTGAKRDLSNIIELENTLYDNGFYILHPEHEEPKHIVKKLAHARVVVGMVGSALAHAQLAMPPGAALVTIQPATLFSGFHKLFADASGIKFAFVVADRNNSELFINIGRLMKTIEMAES